MVATLLAGAGIAAELPGGIQMSAKVQPIRTAPGQAVELEVSIQVPPGWIVYDVEQAPGSVLPTRIELDPIEGVAAAEAFRSQDVREASDPRFANRIVRYFDRSPTFRRPLLPSADARLGERTIRGRASFLTLDQSTGRFFVVSDAPFQTTMAILDPREAADAGSVATSPPIRPARQPAPARPTPKFSLRVDPPLVEPEPPAIEPAFLSPWAVGVLLILIGAGWGAVQPPTQRPRHVQHDAHRRAA